FSCLLFFKQCLTCFMPYVFLYSMVYGSLDRYRSYQKVSDPILSSRQNERKTKTPISRFYFAFRILDIGVLFSLFFCTLFQSRPRNSAAGIYFLTISSACSMISFVYARSPGCIRS